MSNIASRVVGVLVLTAMIALAADPPVTSPEANYTCPMHPQVRWPKQDKCPLCSMQLQKVSALPASASPAAAPMSVPAPTHRVHMANDSAMPAMTGDSSTADGSCPHCAKGMSMPMNGAAAGSQMPSMNCHSPGAAMPVSSPKGGGSSGGGRRGCGC